MQHFSLGTNACPMESHVLEVVERKGVGHPDTLADGIAEAISLTYSRYCQERFGVILHHNVDKSAIFGGLAEMGFGKAVMQKAHRLILGGRMSCEFADTPIDFNEIQEQAARQFLNEALPNLDTSRWLEVQSLTTSSSRSSNWFRPKSRADVPDADAPWANDTSACAGYWPLSSTEKMALALEGHFYNREGQSRFDYIGRDIKVMAVRNASTIMITMCVPFLAEHTPNEKFYLERLYQIRQGLLQCAKEVAADRYQVELYINTQDQRSNDARGHYLLATGSALDHGEEGMVGRGNRSRGIISSIRPYSMEAIAGKNPVYHVGKVYGYIVDVLAQQIAQQFECECHVMVVTRNGDPLFNPDQLAVQTTHSLDAQEVKRIIEQELHTRHWTEEILNQEPFLPGPGRGHGVRLCSN